VVSSRTLKLLAASYAVKTALAGLVWLVAPELPAQALARLRATWTEITTRP
jgi:hypothetical protein